MTNSRKKVFVSLSGDIPFLVDSESEDVTVFVRWSSNCLGLTNRPGNLWGSIFNKDDYSVLRIPVKTYKDIRSRLIVGAYHYFIKEIQLIKPRFGFVPSY